MSQMDMSERDLEKILKDRVRALGGVALKFVSPGTSGVPDRLIVLPGNKMGFVEVKKPGKKLRPEQDYQIKRLKRLGCLVYVLDNPDYIDQILHDINRDEEDAAGVLADILEAGGLI